MQSATLHSASVHILSCYSSTNDLNKFKKMIRADMMLQVITALIHLHTEWAEYSQCLPSVFLSLLHLLFWWRKQTEAISGRTQTGRQPFKVDLKRIDYLPFRGLLQAAGTEIKAIKAWVGYGCFNNETTAASQSKHSSVRSPLLVVFEDTSVSTNHKLERHFCQMFPACWRLSRLEAVMSQQGEVRDGSDWLCQQV